jgi:Tol biopolymer transport system component
MKRQRFLFLVMLVIFVSCFASAQQYGPWSAPVKVGPPVNTNALEQGPAISKDGLSLYFHSQRPDGFGGSDIYVSQRPSLDAPWGLPQNLGPTINTSANEAAPMLSQDGHRLYFHSGRPGGFGGADIYVSRRHNKRDDFGWRPPANLGSGVNTAAQEQQPVVFEDEATGLTTLYFTSNRPGHPESLGGDDIWASELQPDETFGPAAVVIELSSPSDDRGPALRRDGLEIIFPSNRPGTFGFDDLWVSTRPSTTEAWSEPENLGPLVNSAVTDAQPSFSFDGATLYFNGPDPTVTHFDLLLITRVKLPDPDE